MIDPVSSQLAALQSLQQQKGLEQLAAPAIRIDTGAAGASAEISAPRAPGGASFSDMVTGLVRAVDAKSKAADAEVRRLMVGESDSIHRSMIAMQESGLAFSLLVEVRNKLVESYQELMRMPV